MNPSTGDVYRTPEEIKAALARGERLVPVSELAHAHHTSHTRYVGGGHWKPSNREDIRMERLRARRELRKAAQKS